MWYSQSGQDEWVYKTLNEKQDGFYIDVGAYDGIESSNTYALELIGWKGVCIEANTDAFNRLRQARGSININMAVNHYKGICAFAGDRIALDGSAVQCDILTNILDANGCPEVIDYLSIDIEGKEYDVLRAFDFDKYKVRLITVEHNLYCEGPHNKERLYELLTHKGFTRVIEDVKCLDPNPAWYGKPYEDWYTKF